MSQTFQIRRRVGAQQRQTNSTDRYLWNILQLSAAFRLPLSFGNITKLQQRFLFQNTFMCVCCVSGKFVWKVVTNGSVLWQLSLSPHHSSCPIWSQQLTLLSVFWKTVTKKRQRLRLGKSKDKTRAKTNGFVLLQIAFPPHLSSCPIWLARLDPIRPYLWSFLHRKWSELRLFERRAFTQCNEEKESTCRYRKAYACTILTIKRNSPYI